MEKVFQTASEKFYFISAAMQALVHLEEFMLKKKTAPQKVSKIKKELY